MGKALAAMRAEIRVPRCRRSHTAKQCSCPSHSKRTDRARICICEGIQSTRCTVPCSQAVQLRLALRSTQEPEEPRTMGDLSVAMRITYPTL